MNSGLFPFTMQLRNKLVEEAHSVSVSCGNLIDRLLSVEAGMNYRTDFGGLVTIDFGNTIHTDEDWLFTDVAMTVKQSILRLSETSVMCERWKHNMEYYCGGKIPQSTTCCWVYMDRENTQVQHDMHQYFLNITAGIAQDITSDAFQYVDQIGCNFSGSLFEHCTTIPVWKCRGSDYVTIQQPSENECNLAWEKHRKKSRATG